MTNKNEAGQALIFTVASLVVLMGFAGLAIDMGVMRHDKRLQQTAADAAAIAGASNLTFGGVQAGAQDAASRVGYTDNGGGVASNCNGAAVGTICVEVNNPPKTGPHQAGSTDCSPAPSCYVEVLVADVHTTYFMKVLSINSETITTRAVATILGPGTGNGCMYALATPSESPNGINISGSAILNASNCGIVDDGDYKTTGGALTVSSNTFGVSGNSNVSGTGGSVTCTTSGPCPTFNMPASADPLQYLTPPPVQSPSFGNVTTAGTQTLQPGTYSSINIGSGSTVTLNSGIYYIDGSSGVTFAGSATVKGSGVMIYLTDDAKIRTGGGGMVSNIQLSAPTTGPYAGILMYQDPSDNTNARIGGDDTSFFNGALYFPEGQITFFGKAGGTGINVAVVVADSIVLGGNAIVNLQGSAGLPAGVNLIKNATLVE